METQSNAFLGTEKVSRLMRKFALPCVISLLVGALYNIVDQIYIANASYLGSYGNAANTVVFPLTVIALAIATMLGDGCCAFVSLSLGAQKPTGRAQGRGHSHRGADCQQPCADGDLPDLFRADRDDVRRAGQ